MNLFSIIEEVLSENASLGFGEGKPAKDELSKKQVVSLEEESEEEHDFGGLRDQAKSTDEEGVSTSFRPMKEDTEELEEMSAMGAGAVEGGVISREEFVEELKLREFIQRAIKHVKSERVKGLLEERKLRSVVRCLISEAQTPDVDPTPNRATGINVLEELLKKIIPVLETDYKTLTTNPEQRQSFRAHILNAAENTIKPAMVNNAAGEMATLDEPDLNELQDFGEEVNEAGIDIDIEDDDDFIPIEKEEASDPVSDFGIDGQNETGRNMAYQSFKKIEANILDSYELLSDREDQELFYDYLLTNLKLYFDKFEEELNPVAVEPTTDAYEQAISA